MLALDSIDHAIIEALQRDARLSNKRLAARVGLAPSSCLTRVRRLSAAGVLRGFHAEVAPQSVGVELQALVSIRMARHTATAFADFQTALLALPEVVHLYNVAGREDFFVHVGVRDTDHLRELVTVQIAAREEVDRVETNLIFEHHARPLPLLT